VPARAYPLVGGVPDIVAVRRAWPDDRDVQARAFAVARTMYDHRYRGRPCGRSAR
jgi:hypothetical protein